MESSAENLSLIAHLRKFCGDQCSHSNFSLRKSLPGLVLVPLRCDGVKSQCVQSAMGVLLTIDLAGHLRVHSLTINRGGQSRRCPSLWACNNASVQSWKKWLRSLNPKSRTIRSNVSRCSRRTLVVRLPCAFWVNPVSVFILDDSRQL